MAADRRTAWGGGAARLARAALAFAVMASGSGCDNESDGYDPALRYPLRPDVVVLQPPPVEPDRPAEPGKLDEALANFGTLGGVVLDPTHLPESDMMALRQALDAAFGTPAAPRVPADVSADDPRLTPDALANGGRLYRRHCSHCHGLTGDGRGPTGIWLYPYPRDFRPGVFKAGTNGKPNRADLARVIRAGVPGTSMQPFDLISDDDLNAIIGYVIHLSLRGEVEVRAIRGLLEGDLEGAAGLSDDVQRTAMNAWRQWQSADAPTELPVSFRIGADADEELAGAIRRGHKLFAGSAGCLNCHADYGRQEQYRYDSWGGAARVPDLTRGEYRWGGEPSDIARRIRHGISGTAMPANPTLTDDQLRDLAAFVLALPTPPRLPPDVRGRIYPGPAADASAMRR